MADLDDLHARIKVLSDAYAAQLPDKLKQIEQAWSQFPSNEWDEDGFQTLHLMVHSLSGSGKTFGFALLSDVARKLESDLQQLAQAKRVPDEEQRKRIRVLLSELQQVAVSSQLSPD